MADGNQTNRPDAIRQQIKDFPTGPGLYVMKDADDHVLYIGKAKNLRNRVSSYFQPGADLITSRGPKIAEMVSRVWQVDFIPCDNEVEAILKEARLIKDIRPPYNTDLVDDKTFPYLEITIGDEFPAVYVTRRPRPAGSRLFGPFPNVADLRAAVQLLQRIYRFRTCSLDISESDPKRRFFRPCLLYSIKQCTAPCAAKIDKTEYRGSITDLIRFLRSKRSTVLKQLHKQMAQAAVGLEYEKAAMYRDRIRLIERLGQRGIPDLHVQPEVFASDPTEAIARLRDVLQLEGQIRIIEGIDVAHIAGSQAVGALVKFIDGRPFKAGYRRFKIKNVEGIDDYAMIAEVVRRRYLHVLQGEEPWPEIILIDGGIGQLNAAHQALGQVISVVGPSQVGQSPILIALAKQEELIYRQGWPMPLGLPTHDPALKLLQYIRDEAHRFAQHYHHLLRSKTITEQSTQ